MIHETSINVFAVPALLQVSDLAGGGQPLLGAFTAQVAFDDEELFAEVREVFLRIVAALQPDQATSGPGNACIRTPENLKRWNLWVTLLGKTGNKTELKTLQGR